VQSTVQQKYCIAKAIFLLHCCMLRLMMTRSGRKLVALLNILLVLIIKYGYNVMKGTECFVSL